VVFCFFLEAVGDDASTISGSTSEPIITIGVVGLGGVVGLDVVAAAAAASGVVATTGVSVVGAVNVASGATDCFFFDFPVKILV